MGNGTCTYSADKICSFEQCESLAKSKGLCQAHYCQLLKGQILKPKKKMRTKGSLPIILYDLEYLDPHDLNNPCHIFLGSKKNKNKSRAYGQIWYQGKTVLVHRYIWEQTYGPIPDNLEIDHICRNPSCCNIKHLRCVTHQINTTENIVGANWQINKAKTHCPQGHEYTEENTRHRPNNGRSCKECARKQKQLKKKLQRLEKKNSGGKPKKA